jgi:hypothetical protein
MSACALRRWGPGTPCTRPADTPASKEMAAALAKMQAERDLQDKMWEQPLKGDLLVDGSTKSTARNGIKKGAD